MASESAALARSAANGSLCISNFLRELILLALCDMTMQRIMRTINFIVFADKIDTTRPGGHEDRKESVLKFIIYMLRDDHPNRFMGFEWAYRHSGINLSDYQQVYTGTIVQRRSITEMLEEIYSMFNLRDSSAFPGDYIGRSLSVSDLVELEGEGIYFCDSVGFKNITERKKEGQA